MCCASGSSSDRNVDVYWDDWEMCFRFESLYTGGAPQDAQTHGPPCKAQGCRPGNNSQGMMGSVFEVLMEATKYCSLGQLTAAIPLRRDRLFEVGGQYRRIL